MNTTLLIMAAGLGSRYGKQEIKQLAKVGPKQETILEYSIYDAIEAGFNKVVLIIRKELQPYFDELIDERITSKIEVEYIYQEIPNITGRIKPLGTGHAILSCKDIIHEPFLVINADDYYGKSTYKLMHDTLIQGNCCMAGFILKNTLSTNGGVSRGICEVEHGYLKQVKECKNISLDTLQEKELNLDMIVSMNMWGLVPEVFISMQEQFDHFMLTMKDPINDEFHLPSCIANMIENNIIQVKVLESKEKWIGVTYLEDKDHVCKQLENYTSQGKYPTPLF